MSEKRNFKLLNFSFPFRGREGLDCLFFAILGYLVIYFFARYSGIGISPDSIMYASTAQNLHDNFSIITFNGKPLTFFPVFYPFFLSLWVFISGGTDPVTLGPVINGILFGSTIFLSGWTTTLFKNPSHVYRWIILAAVLLSPAMQEIYTYLWSETLFILEILIFIVAYRQYTKTHGTKALIVAAAVAAVSCITRYAGITLVGAGGLLILTDGALKPKQRFAHLMIFGSISISLLIGNLLMNRVNTGLSTGTREPSITPLSENLHYFGVVLLDWAGLPASWDPAGTFVTVAVILLLAGMFVWHLLSKQRNGYQRIFIVYALSYTLFIVIFASISRFERINSRLISPVFIPMLMSLTGWAPDVVHRFKKSTRWLIATPMVVAMLAFFYVIAPIDYQRYDDFREYGIPGYTDDDWNKSDFIVFLKNHKHMFKPNVPIFSDADEAVYMFTGMHATLLPHKFFKKDVEDFFKHQRFYLIDFKKMESPEIIGLNDIKARKKVTLLNNYEDGAVYLVE